jgi:hypothetical protein
MAFVAMTLSLAGARAFPRARRIAGPVISRLVLAAK